MRYAHLLDARGLVAGTSGNLSVRLDDGRIVVTPTKTALRALSATACVVVDADGHATEGAAPTSELPLHRAVYRVRVDARCVIHTHPTYVTAWSKTGGLFPLDTVGAIESLGPVAFAPYAPSGSEALAESCAAAFATGAQSVVMERHGLACTGVTLEEAFARTDLAEQTARIEAVARSLA